MKYGPESAATQQIRQLASIDAIILAATTVVFAWIADQNLGYTRLQQSSQPLGRGAFFERDIQLAAQQLQQFQHSGSAGGDDALQHQLSPAVENCNRNGVTMYIQTDVSATVIHEGAPCCRELWFHSPSTYSTGAPFHNASGDRAGSGDQTKNSRPPLPPLLRVSRFWVSRSRAMTAMTRDYGDPRSVSSVVRFWF